MRLSRLATFTFLFITPASLVGQARALALAPGLLGEYFRARPPELDQMANTAKPFFVRIDPQIDFASVDGDFYGSKLADDLFIRWTGVIRIAQAGGYSFGTNSDDGSRLYIDGQRVVDNWGPHPMTSKAGTVTLDAGDHAIRVTFSEGGGGAGCIASWTPPGGRAAPIPTTVLFHDPASARAALESWDQQAWRAAKAVAAERNTGVAFAPRMGPVVTTAVSLGRDARGDNTVYRAIIIRLDDAGEQCVVFDADTLRLAGGWTDGSLSLQGLPFTDGHGQYPAVRGELVFRLRAIPGWARASELRDPRHGEYPPLGPLPKDWAHYQGLYLDGDRVVLRYTVGGAGVLETPSIESNQDGSKSIVRALRIERDGSAMTLVLADADAGADADARCTLSGDVAVLGDPAAEKVTRIAVSAAEPAGTKAPALGHRDGLLVLDLPPSAGVTTLTVTYTRCSPAQVDGLRRAAPRAPDAIDFAALTDGGATRWPKTFTTHGGLAPADQVARQAYVLDRLTVPYKNEYEPRMRIGGMDFFADGKSAAVSTWDGDVWIIKGITGDLAKLEWKRFASGLHEPLGLKIVGDVVYTVDDMQITRLHDLDGNGEADYYENFNNDWQLTSGFHAFCFDLHTDPQGNFYFAFGSPVRGGGRSFERMGDHHGSILRVSKDGKRLERYATGLRAPNGICVGPDGQVTSGDNEGTFVPRCPIHWIKQGDFLGVVDAAAGTRRETLKTTATRKDRVPAGRPRTVDAAEMPRPLAWLPRSVDNSGGGQAWVTSDKWGPLEGNLLHMSYGQSSLYLVLKERKGNQMQGGVVKIPLRFTSSAMRGRFNPGDGQLYVAGLRGWQTNAVKSGGFDRVRYTGQPLAMPVGLTVQGTGLEITFADRLEPELANDAESFGIRAADIRWTQAYGSNEYKIGQRLAGGKADKLAKGWSDLAIASARLLADGKTVRLGVPTLQPVHEMEISMDLETTGGASIRTKIWCTVHVVDAK